MDVVDAYIPDADIERVSRRIIEACEEAATGAGCRVVHKHFEVFDGTVGRCKLWTLP